MSGRTSEIRIACHSERGRTAAGGEESQSSRLRAPSTCTAATPHRPQAGTRLVLARNDTGAHKLRLGPLDRPRQLISSGQSRRNDRRHVVARVARTPEHMDPHSAQRSGRERPPSCARSLWAPRPLRFNAFSHVFVTHQIVWVDRPVKPSVAQHYSGRVAERCPHEQAGRARNHVTALSTTWSAVESSAELSGRTVSSGTILDPYVTRRRSA